MQGAGGAPAFFGGRASAPPAVRDGAGRSDARCGVGACATGRHGPARRAWPRRSAASGGSGSGGQRQRLSGAWRAYSTTGTVTAPPPTTSAQQTPTAALPPPLEQLGDDRPRAPRGEPAQPRRPGAQVALERAAVRAAPQVPARDLAGAHARRAPPPRARPPPTRTRSRARRRSGAGSRGRAPAASASCCTVVSSCSATSSCESPSSALMHQHRPLPVGQAVDVAQQRPRLGAGGELVGQPAARRRAPPPARPRRPAAPCTRRSSSRQALRTSRSSQARGSIGTTPDSSAAWARR